jgi:hypothetical protein
VSLTPAQCTTAWYFFAVAALLVQTLLGGATAHYLGLMPRLAVFGADVAPASGRRAPGTAPNRA